jgi:glycosyltransferase involved in cell wall biosynthesis
MSPPSAPRHVLMTTDAVGGVWVFATSLARELCRRGDRVTLVTLGPAPQPDQVQALREIPGLSVDVTDLALEWMDPGGRDAARAFRVLAELERRTEPDVVHLNSYREASASWIGPVLVTAHSCARSWHLACRSDEPSGPDWNTYAANVADGLLAADLWTAPTAAFGKIIDQLYVPPPGRRVWNGVDVAPPGVTKQPFIMAAGRFWDESKNLSVLASIEKSLTWPVRVAGPLHWEGNSVLPSRSIHWLGELPRRELLARLQTAEIFVSPALYEPFGLTVLEAAAAGCALVLSDIPSFRELWDGAASFVDPRDRDALRDAINQLCRDQVQRQLMQRAASERAGRYRLSRTVEAYSDIYSRLSGTTHATRTYEASMMGGHP